MRYFNEEKQYIGQSFDTEEQIVDHTDTNNYAYNYIITQQKQVHYEHNEIPYTDEEGEGDKIEFPDGRVGYRDHEVVDKEEEGYWQYVSEDGYTNQDIEEPPADFPHEQSMQVAEEVGIVRDLTEEEIAEREEAKEKQRTQMGSGVEQSQGLNDLYNDDANEDAANANDGLTALYESLPAANEITNTEPFAKAYMTLIARGKKSLADVPESIKAEVETLIAAKDYVELTGVCVNGTTNNDAAISRYYKHNITASFIVKANTDARVPDIDEINSRLTITAHDKENQIIEDYFKKFGTYNIMPFDNEDVKREAILRLVLPYELKDIDFTITCPLRIR